MSFSRPDERVLEEQQKKYGAIESGLKKGVKFASAAAIGAGILPFLSEHIPLDLAMKGINKLSPVLGKFLKDGQSIGLDVKEGLNLIKDKIGEQNVDIISQESPELKSFLEAHISNGRSLEEAGALAQLDEKYKSPIKKLEKSHKTNFSNILRTVFGDSKPKAAQPTQAAPQPQAPQQAPAPQNGPPATGSRQPFQGNSDQAIIEALQKVLQM